MEEKNISEKESIEIISMMINKAKDSYYDTGLSAMMWGIVITICSLVKYSEVRYGVDIGFDIYWLTLIAIIPQIYISIKEKKERKVKSYDDVFMNYLWLAFGISIFLMSFIANMISNGWQPVSEEFTRLAGHEPSFHFYEFITPLFLLLYGIPTFVTGVVFKFKPLLLGAILCWICCATTCFTTIQTDLLLTALAAIVAWLIPGIIIRKQHNRMKKELRAAHV